MFRLGGQGQCLRQGGMLHVYGIHKKSYPSDFKVLSRVERKRSPEGYMANDAFIARSLSVSEGGSVFVDAV